MVCLWNLDDKHPTRYVPVVGALSGLNVVNLGIPGGCLTPDGWGKGDNKRAVMNMDDGKEKADLITLEVLPSEGALVGNQYDTDDESLSKEPLALCHALPRKHGCREWSNELIEKR